VKLRELLRFIYQAARARARGYSTRYSSITSRNIGCALPHIALFSFPRRMGRMRRRGRVRRSPLRAVGVHSMEFKGRRYFDDPYRTEFAAVVTAVERTPEESSPCTSTRRISTPIRGAARRRRHLGGFPVAAVTEDERGVRHLVKPEPADEVGRLAVAAGMDAAATFVTGARVAGVVDAARRLDHMRQHTGQHLLSRVFLDECR